MESPDRPGGSIRVHVVNIVRHLVYMRAVDSEELLAVPAAPVVLQRRELGVEDVAGHVYPRFLLLLLFLVLLLLVSPLLDGALLEEPL
jgi:hypothetical protein